MYEPFLKASKDHRVLYGQFFLGKSYTANTLSEVHPPTAGFFSTYVHLQSSLTQPCTLCNHKIIATFDLVPNKCTNV